MESKIKLYLDIDGVLLTVKQKCAADDSDTFIRFALANFDCYWLTTHCKGNNKSVLKYLSKYFDADIIEELKSVKVTDWDTLKIEALDFTTDFFWIEDYPMEAEMRVAQKYEQTDKVIVVNLNNDKELQRVVSLLKIKIENG